MKKTILLVSILFSCTFSLFAQTTEVSAKKKAKEPLDLILQTTFKEIMQEMVKDENINRYDKDSLKTGFWIEDDGFRDLYYKKGKRNGFVKYYDDLTGRLVLWGEYRDDKRVGTWYHFNIDTGLLEKMEQMIPIETETVELYNKAKIECKFKAYRTNYYPNGEKESEGVVLYNKPLLPGNFGVRLESHIGVWKEYNEQGNLIEKKK